MRTFILSVVVLSVLAFVYFGIKYDCENHPLTKVCRREK